jgi:hypothetical protein
MEPINQAHGGIWRRLYSTVLIKENIIYFHAVPGFLTLMAKTLKYN